ncbi:hypothetical protein F5144DRAFT_240010 [Chaetomium tenue]|uniref:Uncharacterized protein n=1 Tax=Chaetomium tenue TaxID=1854479 RepID=A0ACB7P9G5_9PEZI|nr:hypothetical protein F5144DRAFT_240010 [Chaetomium globosum]
MRFPFRYTGPFHYIHRRFGFKYHRAFLAGFHHRFGETVFFPGTFRIFSLLHHLGAWAEWAFSATRATTVDRQGLKGFRTQRLLFGQWLSPPPLGSFQTRRCFTGGHMSTQSGGTFLLTPPELPGRSCSLGAIQKSLQFCRGVFLSSKVCRVHKYISGAISTGTNRFAWDSVMRLKSWTCDRPFPLLHSFVFPFSVWFGGHHVFLFSLSV